MNHDSCIKYDSDYFNYEVGTSLEVTKKLSELIDKIFVVSDTTDTIKTNQANKV